VSQTTKMLESFYPEHVIKRLPGREETFWEQHNLEPNDWQGWNDKYSRSIKYDIYMYISVQSRSILVVCVLSREILSRFKSRH